MRQRSLDERRRSVETTRDQEKVVAGSRATFYMSLAVVANLKCKVTSADGDAALSAALGRTRETLASINGSRDFDEYRVAIDAALARK